MKKSYKGFTLAEVIVSLLVVTIILAFAVSFFFTGENLFRNTVKSSDDKQKGDAVLQYLSESVRYADSMEILQSQKSADAKYDNTIYLASSGHIALNTSTGNNDDVFGDYFYSHNIVSYSVKVLGADSVELCVIVKDDKGEEQYKTSEVVKLLNMNVSKKAVEVDASLKNIQIDNAVISYNHIKNTDNKT